MSAPVDHPGPDPADLSDVGVSKPDHPPPWMWSGYSREWHYLLDGRHDRILFSRDKIEIASPVARTLIAVAPEMETLLRLYREGAACCPGVNLDADRPVHDVDCPLAALLARIDEARRG